MTDKETLLQYRINQADETCNDARKMLEGGFSLRSVANRAYYSAFYALLALFLKIDYDLKTSKHSGVISMFDKEFIHGNRFDKRYSRIVHRLFDARQEADYKEFTTVTPKEAEQFVEMAENFLQAVRVFLDQD